MPEPIFPERLVANYAFELRVNLTAPLTIGPSKLGLRRLIPIAGGTFEGPDLQGEIVPGGADWQLTRPDGVLEIDARYTIRASDGVLIHVRNRGIVVFPPLVEKPYVRTVPEFEAPLESPHAWLNRTLFLGTLQLVSPTEVRVRMYRVG
jgi:hypothetical protein